METVSQPYAGFFFNDFEPFAGRPRPLLRDDPDYQPRMDLKETDKEVQIFLDTPGMEKKDIDISIEENVLVMKGERKDEDRTSENGYIHTERFFGSFERRIRLPENVQEDRIRADYKDGCLTVSVPKTEIKKPEAKKIRVG